ncbi:MAG: hypothetical protein MUC62_07170 [Candidatus Thermoplasmatota archaeon]|jgi:hypothetical protein|nr:hypothetical protein [Candidatus Thermoplasmatota archaeon]
MKENKPKRAGRFVVPAGAVYALAAAMALICFTVLAVVIAGPGDDHDIKDPPVIKVPHLYIEDVFFSEESTADTTLKMTIYITNDGTDDAQDVTVDIWPVAKETNIATKKQTFSVGDIQENCTSEGTVTIELHPSVLHSVEVRVLESGMLVLKGKALVTPSGKGGSEYQNVQVKGSRLDSDYDGMPDEWERYYGLDPSDPTDAVRDKDGDGILNIDEYKTNEPPAHPADGDDDDDNGFDLGPELEDRAGAPIFLGAGLMLLLVIGVIAILIGVAVRSSTRKEESRAPLKGPERDPPHMFEHKDEKEHSETVQTSETGNNTQEHPVREE